MALDLRRILDADVARRLRLRLQPFSIAVRCPYAPTGTHRVVWDRGALGFECPVPLSAEGELRALAGLPLAGCSGFLTLWRHAILGTSELPRDRALRLFAERWPALADYPVACGHWRVDRHACRGAADPLASIATNPKTIRRNLYRRFREQGVERLGAALKQALGSRFNTIFVNHDYSGGVGAQFMSGSLALRVRTNVHAWLLHARKFAIVAMPGAEQTPGRDRTVVLGCSSETRQGHPVCWVISPYDLPRRPVVQPALIDTRQRKILAWIG